jgi:hypothetical protein
MRLDYLHLEGLSRDQGGQTSSGLPFRRWRKVCSQGCPPLRRNRTAARRPRCLVSGGQWPLSLPVDCLDRPGDAFLASPFCLWRRGVVLVRDETRTTAFSSPRHPPLPCHPRATPVPRFRRAFAMRRADSREFPVFNRLCMHDGHVPPCRPRSRFAPGAVIL